MSKRPIVQVRATFLAPEEGGRVCLPDLTAGRYMPHLVVQPSNVREAVIKDGNVIAEDYLAVSFIAGPSNYLASQSGLFAVELMNYPRVKYESLGEGSEFTIREGPRVIGFGLVIARPDHAACGDFEDNGLA